MRQLPKVDIQCAGYPSIREETKKEAPFYGRQNVLPRTYQVR